MAKVLANSGGPDQMLHPAASDLGLHSLPITYGNLQTKMGYGLFGDNSRIIFSSSHKKT